MIDEKLAKEQLEDETDIYFEHYCAKYNEKTKTWTFNILNKAGRRIFRATTKDDFAPYIALSEHLNVSFETLIEDYVWIYGEELEIIPNEMQKRFCYTEKGWLAVSDIVKVFTERFGMYAKDYSLQDITWKLIIDKNECNSSTYKENDKPGWAPLTTKKTLELKDLEDKIIKYEKKEPLKAKPQYTQNVQAPPPAPPITSPVAPLIIPPTIKEEHSIEKSYKIGDEGPGGGIVFYVSKEGFKIAGGESIITSKCLAIHWERAIGFLSIAI